MLTKNLQQQEDKNHIMLYTERRNHQSRNILLFLIFLVFLIVLVQVHSLQGFLMQVLNIFPIYYLFSLQFLIHYVETLPHFIVILLKLLLQLLLKLLLQLLLKLFLNLAYSSSRAASWDSSVTDIISTSCSSC